MSDLVVIVPSRGRPDAARELVESFTQTCTTDTRLWLAIDRDDPDVESYPTGGCTLLTGEHHSMVEALNNCAAAVTHPPFGEHTAPFAIGFAGDDHRPRTIGWDQAYLDTLRELGTGIVYGNDLLQGENLPTQCAMTADIVVALGWMCPPVLHHMCVDDFWRDLGRGAGCLRYLPDVVVEHMHPVAGKAEWTDGHRRVNAPAVYSRDRTAYARFRADGSMARSVAAVRGLRT